jgi:hypothetical protein
VRIVRPAAAASWWRSSWEWACPSSSWPGSEPAPASLSNCQNIGGKIVCTR